MAEFPAVAALRDRPVARQRVIKFQEDEDGSNFKINDKAFDLNRVDTVVRLGDLEEWTIENWSAELHVFHIHQLDFQVTESGGSPFRSSVIRTPSTCRCASTKTRRAA